MQLRKKILISNILMVALPIALTVLLCMLYVGLGGKGFVAADQKTDGSDYLGRSQGVLALLESHLYDMDWEMYQFAEENGQSMVLIPDEQAIGELEDLGFHLQVESEQGLLFSNAGKADERAIEATRTDSDCSMGWYGSRLVIQDNIVIDGRFCQLIAVYNEAAGENGSLFGSTLMVAPTTFILFCLFAIASAAVSAFVLTRWLRRSVEEPLGELRAAAGRVEAGDLERRISYPKQDEFGEVCDAFDEMRKRLKNAEDENVRYEEERQELMRGISHDLRSPLTSIVGYASGIKDGIADTDEKRDRYCDAILTRASDLEHLVENLSVLTKSGQSGELKFERMPLGAFIEEDAESRKAWFESKNIAVNIQDDSDGAAVMLDSREMRRVFGNLFENTAKHRNTTSSSVRITVSIHDAFASVRYLDDGPGVPEQSISHIFESFYRADESRTRQGEGSGLGLAIVKRIIEEHGGTISAMNDGGLAIVMQIPLAEGKVS